MAWWSGTLWMWERAVNGFEKALTMWNGAAGPE